jgi:hypothetical protein
VKKIVLLLGLIFLSLVFVNSVSAEFNITKSHEWLYNKMNSTNWGGSVEELSLSILALRNEGYDVSEGVAELKLQQNNDDSFGSVYSTSLATLALHKTGNNVSSEIEWLLDQRIAALTNGNWLIQLRTENDNVLCKITYGDEDFDFTVNNTIIEETGSPWIDFENNLNDYGLADVYETFGVNCVGQVSTSILFRTSSNQYYIVDESPIYEIENACFTSNSLCNCGYTGYAGFVLNELGENPATYPYLETSCTDTVLGNAFLLDLTGENRYANLLIEKQSGGNWEDNKFNTALISYILKNSQPDGASAVSDAKDWMEMRQMEDGSWDASIKTTAMVIWAMFSTELPPTPSTAAVCGDGIIGIGEQCDVGLSCSSGATCTDCLCVAAPVCTEIDECTASFDCLDGYFCDLTTCSCEVELYECVTDSDCTYPKDHCDLATHTCIALDDEPADDSEPDVEESNWLAWMIAIIVILIGAGAGYYAYTKYKEGSSPFNKSPSIGSSPTQQPTKPTYVPSKQAIPKSSAPVYKPNRRDTMLENELDKSISKAKDLLKGRK